MNQGRIWCVVNPTIGLPLFLGGVAAISLIVHASVMNKTEWVAKFWQGSAAKRASLGDTAPVAKVIPGSGFSISVSPVAGSTSFVVSVTPSDDQAVKQVAAAPIAK